MPMNVLKIVNNILTYFLIREILCTSGECMTTGLASMAGMCSKDDSHALVQDIGLSTGYTIAHEFGHL